MTLQLRFVVERKRTMKKTNLMRKFLPAFLIGAMACSTTAFAASDESGHKPLDGGYDAQSILYAGAANTYRGSVWLQTEDSSRVPANDMYAKAELAGFDGVAFQSSDWKRNTTTNYFTYAVTPKTHHSEPVCSRGQFYTGTGNDMDSAPATVYVGGSRAAVEALMAALELDGTYPETEAGETYGSTLLADVVGCEPDLIAARGTNGLDGYVRNEDLNPAFNCKAALEAEADGEVPDFQTAEAAKAYYAAEAASTRSDSATMSAETAAEHQISKWLVNGAYRKTSTGKTYGPITLEEVVGTAPDLVAVRGVNGKNGFAKLEDYDPGHEIKTLEDAVKYNQTWGQMKERSFPVYDLNGTVIDEFIVVDVK